MKVLISFLISLFLSFSCTPGGEENVSSKAVDFQKLESSKIETVDSLEEILGDEFNLILLSSEGNSEADSLSLATDDPVASLGASMWSAEGIAVLIGGVAAGLGGATLGIMKLHSFVEGQKLDTKMKKALEPQTKLKKNINRFTADDLGNIKTKGNFQQTDLGVVKLGSSVKKSLGLDKVKEVYPQDLVEAVSKKIETDGKVIFSSEKARLEVWEQFKKFDNQVKEKYELSSQKPFVIQEKRVKISVDVMLYFDFKTRDVTRSDFLSKLERIFKANDNKLSMLFSRNLLTDTLRLANDLDSSLKLKIGSDAASLIYQGRVKNFELDSTKKIHMVTAADMMHQEFNMMNYLKEHVTEDFDNAVLAVAGGRARQDLETGLKNGGAESIETKQVEGFPDYYFVTFKAPKVSN